MVVELPLQFRGREIMNDSFFILTTTVDIGSGGRNFKWEKKFDYMRVN